MTPEKMDTVNAAGGEPAPVVTDSLAASALATGSAFSRYAWIGINRTRGFATWDEEVAHMRRLGFELVPPDYKVPSWQVRLMAPGLTPALFVCTPSGPREMDANLDHYAGTLGYPLYYKPNSGDEARALR